MDGTRVDIWGSCVRTDGVVCGGGWAVGAEDFVVDEGAAGGEGMMMEGCCGMMANGGGFGEGEDCCEWRGCWDAD